MINLRADQAEHMFDLRSVMIYLFDMHRQLINVLGIHE